MRNAHFRAFTYFLLEVHAWLRFGEGGVNNPFLHKTHTLWFLTHAVQTASSAVQSNTTEAQNNLNKTSGSAH